MDAPSLVLTIQMRILLLISADFGAYRILIILLAIEQVRHFITQSHLIQNQQSILLANSFNGIFYHPSFAAYGRGLSTGDVCETNLPLGRMEGNTCHGHARFGTYFVASSWYANNLNLDSKMFNS